MRSAGKPGVSRHGYTNPLAKGRSRSSLVRKSQEASELAIKGFLRELAIEYPKTHVLGRFLRRNLRNVTFLSGDWYINNEQGDGGWAGLYIDRAYDAVLNPGGTGGGTGFLDIWHGDMWIAGDCEQYVRDAVTLGNVFTTMPGGVICVEYHPAKSYEDPVGGVTHVYTIPEPATLSLLASLLVLGGVAWLYRRR